MVEPGDVNMRLVEDAGMAAKRVGRHEPRSMDGDDRPLRRSQGSIRARDATGVTP